MTPQLISARLKLVPYIVGLVTDRHVEWLNDQDVVCYSEQRHKKHTLESQHRFLNEFPVGSYIWLIRLESTDRDIGTISAYVDWPNRLANMGILIGEKSLWGQGYGYEAWDTVMDFLFADGQIRKIEAGCMKCNRAMVRICEQMGMEHESTIANHFMLNDAPQPLVIYGMLWTEMYVAKEKSVA